MTSVQQIRAAIADALKAAIDDWQISPYMLNAPVSPSLCVFPAASQRDEQKRTYTVQAALSAPDKAAQIKLDELISEDGDKSVIDAIESDAALREIVDTVRVTGTTGYRQFFVEGRGLVLGCEWTVEVYP